MTRKHHFNNSDLKNQFIIHGSTFNELIYILYVCYPRNVLRVAIMLMYKKLTVCYVINFSYPNVCTFVWSIYNFTSFPAFFLIGKKK